MDNEDATLPLTSQQETSLDTVPPDTTSGSIYGTFTGESGPTPGAGPRPKVSGWAKLRGTRWKQVQVMSLAQRRLLRAQERVRQKEMLAQMGKRKKFASNLALVVEEGKKKFNEVVTSLKIWNSDLREIEGNMGSGVSTYFKVLMWMLKINVLCMILGIGLIISPGAYMNTNHDFTYTTLYNKDDTKCMTSDVVVNKTGLHFDVVNSVFQIVTGSGWIESTPLFYGWYPASNLTQRIRGVERTVYDYPLAFFMVGCSYFFLSILIMAVNLSRLFQKSATEQVKTRPYSSLVLAGWDLTIHQIETSRLKSITIAKSLREQLRDNEQRDVKRDYTTRMKVYSLRVVTNLVCLTAMVGSIYLYAFTVFSDNNEDRNSCGHVVDNDDGNTSMGDEMKLLWQTYGASIVISVSNVVFPILFEVVGKWEMYLIQSTRIWVTLVRMFIMKLFTMSAYLYILYKGTQPSGGTMESWQNENNTLIYNCWENYIGTQLYQLVMVDFIITCAVILFAEVIYSALATRVPFFRDRLEMTKPEFNIPREILDLVYKQMILWSGYFFSPLLPVVGVIEVVILFYFKKASALRNLRPPGKVIVQSKSISHINGLFLIAILFVFVFNGLVVFNFVPSTLCGPLRGLHSFSSPLIDAVRGNHFITRYIVENLKMTSVIILIIIITGLIIFYYQSIAAAREKMVELLKEQVRMEIADKQFILGQKSGEIRPDQQAWHRESLSARKSKISLMMSHA